MLLNETEIKQRLAADFNPQRKPESPYSADIFDSEPQPAAVLIPFLQKSDGWHVLFIRRTVMPHDRHSGQVAFPGGRCESSDPNAETAALREACEEIGLCTDDVQVLGKLGDMLTITNYRVTPVVGVAPWPYQFTPQPEEVDHIFSIPLSWLSNPQHHEIRMQGLQMLGQEVPVIYFQEYDGELLWGASARIALLLLEALGLANPDNRYAQK